MCQRGLQVPDIARPPEDLLHSICLVYSQIVCLQPRSLFLMLPFEGGVVSGVCPAVQGEERAPCGIKSLAWVLLTRRYQRWGGLTMYIFRFFLSQPVTLSRGRKGRRSQSSDFPSPGLFVLLQKPRL